MYGKCWIYKRATLHQDGQPPVLIDYQNGLNSIDCEVYSSEGELFYEWIVNGNVLHIPLNVSKYNVDSIIRTGSFDSGNGRTIYWEFIFGRFRTIGQYYAEKIMEYGIVALLMFFVLYVLNRIM